MTRFQSGAISPQQRTKQGLVMSFWRLFAVLLTAYMTFITHEASARPLQVVVSIKPIHSLVAGVMAEVGVPDLLVSGARSPHTYALKPSDARKISNADVIFYVGPQFELFLRNPLKAVKAKVLSLEDLTQVSRRSMRAGGIWERSTAAVFTDHVDTDENHPDPDHHHTGTDAHVWLDVQNAAVMVNAIANALSEADSENAESYRRNGARLIARLDNLDADLRALLLPVADRPFFVFHDAYQYFAVRYGLYEAGALTVNPDRPPGARRVAAMKAAISRIGVVCVFSEPQFEPHLINTIMAGTPARHGILDAEGGAAPPGPDHYFQLMQELGAALTRCLSAPL
jgi:zinc transport system substrate-binding protein